MKANSEVLTVCVAIELVVTVQQCRCTGLNKATYLFICLSVKKTTPVMGKFTCMIMLSPASNFSKVNL